MPEFVIAMSIRNLRACLLLRRSTPLSLLTYNLCLLSTSDLCLLSTSGICLLLNMIYAYY